MIKDIGDAAGAIYRFLEQQTEPVNLSTLKKKVEVSSTHLMMGLGWLAREGKINIYMPEDQYCYMISVDK
ncbi:hypothetical protein GF312_08985 [Candidatus Poribacteria bacterium]|nr:hypothetical protein [Candidatus Poribacteria bacterium]